LPPRPCFDLVLVLPPPAVLLRQYVRHRRRQRRLAVIYVSDRAHVHVRLGALEFAFCHLDRALSLNQLVPMTRIERVTSPLPRECSTTELHGRITGSPLPSLSSGSWSG